MSWRRTQSREIKNPITLSTEKLREITYIEEIDLTKVGNPISIIVNYSDSPEKIKDILVKKVVERDKAKTEADQLDQPRIDFEKDIDMADIDTLINQEKNR